MVELPLNSTRTHQSSRESHWVSFIKIQLVLKRCVNKLFWCANLLGPEGPIKFSQNQQHPSGVFIEKFQYHSRVSDSKLSKSWPLTGLLEIKILGNCFKTNLSSRRLLLFHLNPIILEERFLKSYRVYRQNTILLYISYHLKFHIRIYTKICESLRLYIQLPYN